MFRLGVSPSSIFMLLGFAVSVVFVPEPAGAQRADPSVEDEVRLEGGQTLRGKIVREDDVTIMMKVRNYGVIQIPKFKIVAIARGGRVAPTATPMPRLTPTPTPRPAVTFRSRLDAGGVPLVRPSQPPTTATLSAKSLVGGAPDATPDRAASAASPAAVPKAAAPAGQAPAPIAIDPKMVESIVQTLEKGGLPTTEQTDVFMKLLAKNRSAPESLTDLEKEAVRLMSGGGEETKPESSPPQESLP